MTDDPVARLREQIEAITAAAKEYLDYLQSSKRLGTDEFVTLKGRIVTLACGFVAAGGGASVSPAPSNYESRSPDGDGPACSPAGIALTAGSSGKDLGSECRVNLHDCPSGPVVKGEKLAGSEPADSHQLIVALREAEERAALHSLSFSHADKQANELVTVTLERDECRAALQAEKGVSQEHWNYFLMERSETGRLSVALKTIADMDLQFAKAKDMHDRAVAALARPSRGDPA